MEPAGIIQSVYGKNLIVSLRNLSTQGKLQLKQKLVDRQGKDVGIIIDIFGPVKSPYAVVKPLTKNADLSQFIRRDIYATNQTNKKNQ